MTLMRKHSAIYPQNFWSVILNNICFISLINMHFIYFCF
ncbi:hypothetical protein SSYIS1_40650 (plasmid) [Serratia symbiotica]|uniref:Uncharacterized protein n=1 Tax=Serratia symbiotica TaxID=138074 RepID=A0A455VVE0_9GAMM|nr:hypothetical protein SSYIS1_40650 [Serratia symbiotica]